MYLNTALEFYVCKPLTRMFTILNGFVFKYRRLGFSPWKGWRVVKLALNYAVLAVIAMAVNICAQDLVVRSYSGAFSTTVSVLIGTAAGLVVKYYLDKRFVFYFETNSVAHDGRVFFVYSMTGVATTSIFWGFEFGFDYAFQAKEMRYLGGVIGLIIGYVIKYCLDKRYVFISR